MKKTVKKENIVLLHCIDKRIKTMYITAELHNRNLVIRYSLFSKQANQDFIYKFDAKSTKHFMELLSEEDFLNNLKKKFHSDKALEEIKKFADENELKYKVYNHFDYDEYNILRYNFGDIYDDNDRLYYEDGSIIIPAMYKHPQNGVCKIYTAEGNLLYEITYKNNLKNGLMRGYVQDTKTVQIEQYYKDDLLDGIATTYYEDGAFKQKELFENGKYIKTLEKRKEWHVEDWYCV